MLINNLLATSNKTVDISEIENESLKDELSQDVDPIKKLKGIIAHEFVHTQQKITKNINAVDCHLLWQTTIEGMCDFIAELVVGFNPNEGLQLYGNTHEKELWKLFKSEMCGNSLNNWLYNFETIKNKPSDLGYYIGYKITQSYYNKANDKSQAIVDILVMDDPLLFLIKSRYDNATK